MHKHITKPLDWMVKVSSVIVTAPATWIVASRLFYDVGYVELLFLIRFAAVALVEGVMLGNWILLEFDKQAPIGIKARYGLTALVMFFAMSVIAWAHEGPVGLVFRLALLVALVGSGWDTYVYTWQKLTAQIDKDVLNNWRVRRHVRKLSEKYAIKEAEADSAVKHAMLQASVSAQTHSIGLAGKRELLLADQMHDREIKAIPAQVDSVNPVNPVNFTGPLQLSPVRQVLITKKAGPDDIDQRILEIYRQSPGLSLRKAAELVGQSHTSVNNRIKDLEIFGLLRRVDGKIYATSDDKIIGVPEGEVKEDTPSEGF